MCKINLDIYVNKREYLLEVVVNLIERKFVVRGLNGIENSNVDFCFLFENVSIELILIIVDFFDSLGICMCFELFEEL